MAKKKYLDQSRFPKVVTEGYEKEFKNDYSNMLQQMFKDIGTKMLGLIANKK